MTLDIETATRKLEENMDKCRKIGAEAKQISDEAVEIIGAVIEGLSKEKKYAPYQMVNIVSNSSPLQLTSVSSKEVDSAVNYIHLIRLARHINRDWVPALSDYRYCVILNTVGGVNFVWSSYRRNEFEFRTEDDARLFISEIRRLGLTYLGIDNVTD